MPHPGTPPPLTVAFVTGTTPDKWASRWREQRRQSLVLVPIEESDQRAVLLTGDADMVLARLPLDDTDLHLVRLYEELPVAVVARDHPAAAYDVLSAAELTDEQFALGVPDGWPADVALTPQLDFPEMTDEQAIEVAASGSAIAVVPMAVARHFHRRDVVHVEIDDLAPTTVALAWRRDRDDEDTQAFVGVVKGRTSRSSRG